jgi:hypothetical protein
MRKIEHLIGKTFVCTDPDFEGCVGVVEDAWYEDHFPDIEFIRVVGEDFSGTFWFNEGYIQD